ncbi:hypothetical protein OV517_20170 [Salmonella enterica subsp. enterica serovar 1,4,[5],12:i:-]|nr:hypothetical protein [Salmonella enterica subsp. enterica serovar 1,4,[5],12:i:-]
MPAFEWVHVQLHQQKGMISLSPPTICNSAFITMVFVLRRKMGKRWLDLFEEKLAIYKPNDKLALSELHESIREKNGLDLQDLQDWYWKEKMTYAYHKEHKTTISYQKFK